MKSEPVEIRVGTLRVILERCKLEKLNELYANDMVKLEVLSKRRLRVSVRSTGETWEIG